MIDNLGLLCGTRGLGTRNNSPADRYATLNKAKDGLNHCKNRVLGSKIDGNNGIMDIAAD